ncbi:hypothetical protein BOTBODRAFT_150266 [Botryobasidium botryosum FD-172 SS1]|uniref:CREG-like beta-barrel domain-containing protein n=1 Tax=Botryobasidium botryosum (strain FD-172 SS1) TaxID=930990 RepID=A0A067NBE4_BOTB1|nr:hypothetical protein BOTBODRAFT_150266 [Botryobasidium botryosum FD-172 SS1]
MLLIRLITSFLFFALAAFAEETLEDAARLARNLVGGSSMGTLATSYPSNHTSLAGQPFALMEYYAPCYANGSLAILFFYISLNSHNILGSPDHSATITVQAPPSKSPAASPRVALIGNVTLLDNDEDKELESCYLERHPDSKWWVPGGKGEFHGVTWARFDPHTVYYVGGFGRIHYIGYIPLSLYQASGGDPKPAKPLYFDQSRLY